MDISMEIENSEYNEVARESAYELQNAGGVILVCTRAKDGRYDLAPVAWSCPMDNEGGSRFIVVLDTGHKTYSDILETGEFAIALPCANQLELIEECGSTSGFTCDKYAQFEIKNFPGKKIQVLIPEGVAGWVECKAFDIKSVGTAGIVMAEALGAWSLPDSWKKRVHHVGGETFFVPGPVVHCTNCK